jgi:hypothetical protein
MGNRGLPSGLQPPGPGHQGVQAASFILTRPGQACPPASPSSLCVPCLPARSGGLTQSHQAARSFFVMPRRSSARTDYASTCC